jgi:hypothetical protein
VLLGQMQDSVPQGLSLRSTELHSPAITSNQY